MTKFLDVFKPIRKGNFALTDEAIYKSIQHGGQFIPVFGGTQRHIKAERFVSELGKTKHDEPITIFNGNGIIISLDGSAGSMTYVTSGRFALNHHAGFFQIKEGANKSVIPEYFSLFYEKQLQEASISEGSKTLTKATIESLDFNIPQYDIQEKLMLKIKPILKIKDKAELLIDRIQNIKERELSVEYKNYQAKGVLISKILDCNGGNSGLTEKEIYHNILAKGERYEVLSSSTKEDTRLGMIPKCHINGTLLEVFEGKEGILVIRNGRAGNTYFLEKGKYAITDHAYILTLKKDCEYDLSLKWLMAQYRLSFFEYSSSSDNGTWNMTGFFNGVRVDIPSLKEQLELVKKFDYLETLLTRIESILAKISGLFVREVVD